MSTVSASQHEVEAGKGAAIEEELARMRKDIDNLKTRADAINNLLQQGKGAVWLAKLIVAILVFFGLGIVSGHKLQELLAWLGK